MPQALDQQKFKEAIIYISNKNEGDIHYGSVKLNKVMAFAEMIHIAEHGQGITGATYIKKPRGPVAKCMAPELEDMTKNREHVVREIVRFGREYKVPTALRQANLDVFRPTEVATLDLVIDALKDRSNSDVAEWSHTKIPNWDELPDGAEIPLSSLLYPTKETGALTPEDVDFFTKLQQRADKGEAIHDEAAPVSSKTSTPNPLASGV